MILVISSKKTYAAKRLIQEARVKKPDFAKATTGRQELRVMSVADLVKCKFQPKFVFHVLYIRDPYSKGSPKYLPKIVNFAKAMAKQGVRVVDGNIANGKIGQGKWKDYQRLRKVRVRIPETWNYELGIMNYEFKSSPFILKWIYGMGGKNTFLIRSENYLKKIFLLHSKSEWMVQEYIEADFEYKVVCIGYKALPIMLKIKFNKKIGRPDFEKYEVLCHPGPRSGIHELSIKHKRGHRSSIPRLASGFRDDTSGVIALAEKASRALGRELSKVDILEKDGKFFVLEVNRFPGLDGFEKLTSQNVYWFFLKYLQGKI
jgi:glutathione synthase/RimK-type ligase-like ATP-grasp enzyme